MVILIFEGADNLGKSTIISKLTDKFKNIVDVTLMHATGPKCKEGEDPSTMQRLVFSEMISKCGSIEIQEHILQHINKNLVFMDRSHIGEYVYGQLYRNGNPDDILQMVKELHNGRMYFNPVVVHLTASPEFVLSHDDSKSLSSKEDTDKRYELVKKEVELFDEVMTKLNPANYIKINVEGLDGNYRNIDDICNEILSKLKEMNVEIK